MTRRQFSLILVLLVADIATDIALGIFFSKRTANRQPAIRILDELASEHKEVERQRRQNSDLISIIALTTHRELHLEGRIKGLEKDNIDLKRRLAKYEGSGL